MVIYKRISCDPRKTLNCKKEFNDLFTKKNDFFYEYKVECKIGEGSFSEVLKCQDRVTGRLVAAKQLKKNFKSTSHALDIPELIALQKISRHANILEMLESHYDPVTGKVTLIFELMDMSLYDLMKNRKRPVAESRAKRYLYQIVKGVDHLHYHGVFHRDIKPENILIKGDKLKISDLGSIKGVYSKHPFTEYISTRWYRSPECLLTKGYYGPKMDVWAIGCVFYELLTLKPLFPGSNELDQIARINNVLGTPSSKLITRFKKQKSRNISPCFPYKRGTGLNALIPLISDAGRDIFKQMIVYDPDSRTNIRRLYEHKYFNELREEELIGEKVFPGSLSLPTAMQKRSNFSPMWISYLTSTKKRKIKRKSLHQTIVEKKNVLLKTKSNVEAKNEYNFTSDSDGDEGISIYRVKNMEEDENIEDKEEEEKEKDKEKIPGHQQYSGMTNVPQHNANPSQTLAVKRPLHKNSQLSIKKSNKETLESSVDGSPRKISGYTKTNLKMTKDTLNHIKSTWNQSKSSIDGNLKRFSSSPNRKKSGQQEANHNIGTNISDERKINPRMIYDYKEKTSRLSFESHKVYKTMTNLNSVTNGVGLKLHNRLNQIAPRVGRPHDRRQSFSES